MLITILLVIIMIEAVAIKALIIEKNHWKQVYENQKELIKKWWKK